MQMPEPTPKQRVETFHKLHHTGDLLILPNIWDPFGAKLLEKIGYPAVATSSSAVSLSQGYKDGEKLPFKNLLDILSRMVQCVNIPVTADVETAYASTDSQLEEHFRQLIDTGIAGINFEDSHHNESSLIDIKAQYKKIELIRQVCEKAGSDLFINARVDVYIKMHHLSKDEKRQEVIRRGKAYKEAGAHGLYPILLTDFNDIEAIVKETGLPVNVTMIPGLPGFDHLKKAGVQRVSLASGFFKNSVFMMKEVAEKLLKENASQDIFSKMVSSEFLNSIV